MASADVVTDEVIGMTAISASRGLASTIALRTLRDRHPTRTRATVGAPRARWPLG